MIFMMRLRISIWAFSAAVGSLSSSLAGGCSLSAADIVARWMDNPMV